MSSVGKTLRLNRFFLPGKQAGVIVPIDHALTMGPIDGLESVERIASWIRTPGISGIIAHKGMVERLARRNLLGGLGVMVHLNGMSALAPAPHTKELLTQLGTALQLGADAVSVQVNFDGNNDAHNLRLLGAVVDESMQLGVPVLAMVYDVSAAVTPETRVDRIRHLSRIAIELGVDAIKLEAPQSLAQVRPILEHAGKDISIFFAGGKACSDDTLLDLLTESLKWSGAGLCVGRNVFQRDQRQLFLAKLQRAILHDSVRRSPDTSGVLELKDATG